MADSKASSSSGLGFSGALFLLFLALKLTGVINWSWWWVTAPLWAGFPILLVVILVAALVVAAKK